MARDRTRHLMERARTRRHGRRQTALIGANNAVVSLSASSKGRHRRLPRLPVHALVIGSISSVQVGAAWATTIFNQVGAGGACLLRLASASAVMLAVTRPSLRMVSKSQWIAACSLGLVLAGMNLSFYEAISRIPLGTAVTIEFIGPLLVALAGSRRARDLIWAVLAACGIVALCHGLGQGGDLAGFALAATAGLFWGAYILLQAQLGRAFDDTSGLALAMTVAAVAVLPFGVAQGAGKLLDPAVLGVGIAVGMLSSAIPYSLELRALRSLSTATFGILMSLEPAVAAIAGAIVIGQRITFRDAIGIGLVCLASLGASLTSRPTPETLNLGA